MGTGLRLVHKRHFVQALAVAVPSTSTPTRISLKNYHHVTVVISIKNSTTVTGSAITLKQSVDVAGTSEKALAFDTVYQNIDTAASDTLTATAVTSNTFTTDTTNSKGLLYIIEFDCQYLDRDNAFDCFRVGTGDGANITSFNVEYILGNERYFSSTLPVASALVD